MELIAASGLRMTADRLRFAVPRPNTLHTGRADVLGFAVKRCDAVLFPPADMFRLAITGFRTALEDIGFAPTGALAAGVTSRCLER